MHVLLITGVLNILLQWNLSLNILIYQIWFLSIFFLLSFNKILLLLLIILKSAPFFLYNRTFRDFILRILLRLIILLVFLFSYIESLFFLFYFISFLIPIFSSFIGFSFVHRYVGLRNLRVWWLSILIINFNNEIILI